MEHTFESVALSLMHILFSFMKSLPAVGYVLAPDENCQLLVTAHEKQIIKIIETQKWDRKESQPRTLASCVVKTVNHSY